jgi:hypothetical protein
VTRAAERERIISALRAQGRDACYGKGGFFIRGQGWTSYAAARKLAGLDVPEELHRRPRERVLYGDAATIHAIAGKV